MGMFTYPRLDDWTSRWAHFIEDSLHIATDLKMDWEFVNCTQFSGQGIEAITGHNPYEEEGWDHVFTSSEGAAEVIKTRGFKTLDDIIAALFPEIPLSMVHPADVVLIKAAPLGTMSVSEARAMPHGVALADPPFFYAVTPDGLGRGDIYKDGVRAFAVGRDIA